MRILRAPHSCLSYSRVSETKMQGNQVHLENKETLVLDVGGDAASSGRISPAQLRCVTNEARAASHFGGRRCHTGPKSSQDPFPH